MSHTTHSVANQMKMRDREMVPRFLVIAMFALMGLSLAIVTFARVTDQPLRGVPPQSAIVNEIQITMTGTRGEEVIVTDANGIRIASSTDKGAGFIDVISNSVARERKVQAVADNPPLRLVRRENGHTAILDPATGWSIELIGYGADNVAAFARLLD